jgi:predicted amino acid racemase
VLQVHVVVDVEAIKREVEHILSNSSKDLDSNIKISMLRVRREADLAFLVGRAEIVEVEEVDVVKSIHRVSSRVSKVDRIVLVVDEAGA